MKGENKIALNIKTTKAALQWWLNEKVLVEPVYVIDISLDSAEFVLTIKPVDGPEVSDGGV